MRKQYEKPKMFIVDIAPCVILAFSIDKDSQGDCPEDFAKEHRGTWGDLWGEKN